jgi:hypothetical protein
MRGDVAATWRERERGWRVRGVSEREEGERRERSLIVMGNNDRIHTACGAHSSTVMRLDCADVIGGRERE